MKRLILFLLLFLTIQNSFAQTPNYLKEYATLYKENPREANLRWFQEAKFGMFIHYGLYAQLEKGEWVQLRDTIPVAEYAKLKDSFIADGFDAEKITDLALEAGMKYITITAKHHDGFCLFNTKETDFNAISAPSNRDLIKEIYEACEKKGLGLFLYYSYAADWKHPYFYSRESGWENARPAYKNPQPEYRFKKDKDFKKYIEYAHAQLKELLIQYPNIAGIWLDPIMGFYSRPEIFPIEKTYDLIRSMSPHALISFKQGANGEEDFSAPERNFNAKVGNGLEVAQRVYEKNKNKPKEICNTLQRHYWGYSKADDGHHKTSNEIIELLNDLEKQPANLLLNVGPLPNGAFPQEDITILKEVGKKRSLKSDDSLRVTELKNPLNSTKESGRSTPPVKRPNVIIILTDDQGWGDLSVTGNPFVQTPRIDQLANEGVLFNSFYVNPVCSPTRAELLTGKYHSRSGVYGTSAGGERVNLGQKMIGEYFQENGYRTGMFGKWHSGQQFPYHPNSRGFEEFIGYCSGHLGNYFDASIEHNGKPLQSKGYLTDYLTNQAIQYIDKQKENPFFVYLSLNTPHSPMQVPDPWWGKFKDMNAKTLGVEEKYLNHTRAAYAMMENIDWNLEKLYRYLKENDLMENTILVYFGDNGPNGPRWNDGLKGIKGSTYEGGIRSSLIIHYPKINDKIEHRTNQLTSAIDLMPTILDLAGIPFHDPIDGISVKESLLTNKINNNRYIFQHWGNRVSVRKEHYRLDQDNLLYDLINDKGETKPLINHPIHQEMIQKKNEWIEQVLKLTPEIDSRPYPIAGSNFINTHLPAGEAKFSEGIQRSNQYPNDSFLINWTNSSDSIYWNAEVLETGNYYADIYYNAEKDEIGTEIEIIVGNQKGLISIEKEFNAQLKGMENDRFKRIESYVKDFIPQRSSIFQLEKGEQIIRLKRKTNSKGKGIEFKKIIFYKL